MYNLDDKQFKLNLLFHKRWNLLILASTSTVFLFLALFHILEYFSGQLKTWNSFKVKASK